MSSAALDVTADRLTGDRVRWARLDFEDGRAVYEIEGYGPFPVPKERAANLEYRAAIIRQGEADYDARASFKAMARASFHWWLNTFAWTYRQLKIKQGGRMVPVIGGRGADLPFVSWPCQDRASTQIINCVREGRDLVLDKSRDMGASWLILTIFHWFWQFHADTNFLEVSRKADLVDNAGDPDSLFWKHDYLLKNQPAWMRPRFRRTGGKSPKLVNLSLRSTIVGQTTTGNVGHGGRKTGALVDEMARIREAKPIWEGLSSTTACRIGNSTPHGPGFFSELTRSTKVDQVRLPWWDHPEKGRGRRVVRDPVTGKVRVTSPWYEGQVARAVSKREIAENLDMDHMGAGFVFFDADVLNRQRSIYAATPPTMQGNIRWRGEGHYSDRDVAIRDAKVRTFRFLLNPSGFWRLWIDLVKDTRGQLRPPQDRDAVFGIDVSGGQGASNSTVSVFDPEARWKVAEFKSATVDPAELARIVAMAGYWFGGPHNCAFVCWEANGYGSMFGKHLIRLGYPRFYKQVNTKVLGEPKSRIPGWWSNDQSKVDVLEDYRGALAMDKFRNPSPEAIDEAAQYIWFENGGVGPGQLQNEKADAHATHGDLVIGDALAWHAALWAPRMSTSRRQPPPGSAGERRARASERAKAEEAKRKGDMPRPRW